MTRTSVPQTHPPGTGWNDWREVARHHSPYRHHLVEAWRREWQTVEVLRIADLPPSSTSPACIGVRCSRRPLSRKLRDVAR